jgi:hypothetical protein
MNTYREEAEKLIHEHGTRSEKERLAAGMLPDDDLDRAVADVVFAPVLDLQLPLRRKAKHETVLKYAQSLGLAQEGDQVYFDISEEVTELRDAEWQALKAIKAVLPEAQVAPYEVAVQCGAYSRRSFAAKIEVTVGDRVRRLDVMLTPEHRDRTEERGALKTPEVVYKRSK